MVREPQIVGEEQGAGCIRVHYVPNGAQVRLDRRGKIVNSWCTPIL